MSTDIPRAASYWRLLALTMRERLQRYKAPQDVYARHLVSHRGYPLWVPELKTELPKDYQDNGLRIGDVGYVVPEDGSYEVLFNIRLPLDHDLHRDKRLPRNFRPLVLDKADIATHEDMEDAGCVVSSSSVKTIEVTPVEQPSNYRFTLSSSEGALLVLPQGADKQLLRSDRLFGEYAKQHACEWYRFVEEDLKRTISYNSLYLITGLYKARSFAMASFQEAEGTEDIPAQFKVTQLEGGGVSRGYNWSTTRTLDKRVGPKRYTGKPNQAVYISGFKIAVRPEPAGRRRISVKADDPSTQPRHEEFTDTVDVEEVDEHTESDGSSGSTRTSQGSSTNQGTQCTVSLERIPEVSQPFHPSDIINRYLLDKVPSATIAITHDSQWIALLKGLEPHELVEERLIVEALSEKYTVVSRDGSVFLECTNYNVWNTSSFSIDELTFRLDDLLSDRPSTDWEKKLSPTLSGEHVQYEATADDSSTSASLYPSQDHQWDDVLHRYVASLARSYQPQSSSEMQSPTTSNHPPQLLDGNVLFGESDSNEDAFEKISIDSSPLSSTQSPPQNCQWFHDGIKCGSFITSEMVAKHFADHVKKTTRSSLASCQWAGCRYRMMNRQSIVRHVREVHMGHSRRYKDFTRRSDSDITAAPLDTSDGRAALTTFGSTPASSSDAKSHWQDPSSSLVTSPSMRERVQRRRVSSSSAGSRHVAS